MTGEAGEKRKYHPGRAGVQRRLPPAASSGRAVTAQRDICGITRHV